MVFGPGFVMGASELLGAAGGSGMFGKKGKSSSARSGDVSTTFSTGPWGSGGENNTIIILIALAAVLFVVLLKGR